MTGSPADEHGRARADRAADPVTDTERAVLGVDSTDEVVALVGRYAETVLGSPIDRVPLRSGRIDVVWGVELADGRAVAIKVHRPPADLDVLGAVRSAKEQLAASGFPCPAPIAGPDVVDGHVITAEAFVTDGSMPDGTDPAGRHLLVAGLADHIALLRDRTDLFDRVGAGPSWCRYHDGPWPVPHDSFVDFTVMPPEHAWLDDLARRASAQILPHRGDERVLGHADWYAGNVLAADGRLTGSFDWELVAEPEAVIAGFTAACFAASPISDVNLSTPAMAETFLEDYSRYRARPFTADERRAAAGAVTWILAFNARWQVALFAHGLGDRDLLEHVRADAESYLAIGS